MISKNISCKVILFAENIAEQNEKLAAHAETRITMLKQMIKHSA